MHETSMLVYAWHKDRLDQNIYNPLMMINYLSAYLPRRIPWGGCGTGYSLPSIITIGLLFSLCLDHRFITHVNVLLLSCFNRYLKDHSLLWKSLLVLVKRLAFAFIQVVICMMLGFLHCVFSQHFVYYWFRTIYCGLWPTHSWFRRQSSK